MARNAKYSKVFTLNFSYSGVVVAWLFVALSLTPSLLPRTALFQGLVSGIAAMIGYGLGLGGQKIWEYLQLPKPGKDLQPKIDRVVQVLTGAIVLFFALNYVGWQNTVRGIFGETEISFIVLLPIAIVTVFVAGVILIVARSVRKLFQFIRNWVDKYIPRRLANVLAGAVAAMLIFFLVNGLLVQGLFNAANEAFSTLDTTNDEGVEQPTSNAKSGSEGSLSEWETLGRQGRKFVSTGPTVDQLNEYHGGGAVDPVRVYVGLKAEDDLEDRAQLLLDELIRTNAFDREVLVVATTTGTGWLDPKAVDVLEYIYNGDSAIAGAQYSYLPSWISLLADQQVAKDTSLTVFGTVYEYWRTLPEDSRPELYIYGLSLGSFGAESILTSINIVNEPINGALLAGPPFVNTLWSDLTNNRDEGSPASLPVVDDGVTVRFTAEENALNDPTGEWGDTKIVYTQHATDPVVFFSPGIAFREPDWLKEGQRGPDVTPDMSWIPFVTMWQVAADLPGAGAVANGFGHNYSRPANVNSWAQLTEPSGWTEADTDRLQQFFGAEN